MPDAEKRARATPEVTAMARPYLLSAAFLAALTSISCDQAPGTTQGKPQKDPISRAAREEAARIFSDRITTALSDPETGGGSLRLLKKATIFGRHQEPEKPLWVGH